MVVPPIVPIIIAVLALAAWVYRYALERRIDREIMSDSAVLDPATGAYLPRAAERRLDVERARCDRLGTPLVIQHGHILAPGREDHAVRWALDQVAASGSLIRLSQTELLVLSHDPAATARAQWQAEGITLHDAQHQWGAPAA